MGEVNGSSNWGWRQFAGALVVSLVTVAGWFVGDRLSARQDFENDRRQLRTQYLLETYRRIAVAGLLGAAADEKALRGLAVAALDIQNLGTGEQIQRLREVKEAAGREARNKAELEARNEAQNEAWRKVMGALRDDLRAEFRMPPESGEFIFPDFRPKSSPSN